jgi:predicted permease
LGRDIRADEFGPDGPAVVILSHRFWQARFGGSSDVLGKSLMMNGYSYEVVGVAPPGFDYPNGAELWIPRRLDPESCGRGCHTMIAVGRLAPGATVGIAQSEADRIAANLTAAYADTNTNKSFLVRSLQDQMVGDVRRGLLLLLGAVGLLVLIACANVANLLLVRASTRTGEIAIRTALGASHGRLAGQALIESGVLAVLGGSAGLLLASASLELLPRLATGIPRMESIEIDGVVLLFALGTVVLVTFLFGTAPALALLRLPVRSGLAQNTPGGGESRGRRRFRNLLLAGEMALSALLLVGAGLLLRSFGSLYAVDVGFETRDIVRFHVMLSSVRYDSLEKVRAFYRDLEERIRALPGVDAVGSVWGPPLGRGHATGTVLVAGRPEPSPEEEREASIHAVGPGWMETMRIRPVRGRGLTARDDLGPELVAMVNETFVRENFAGEDPIGKEVRVTVSLGYGSPSWRIVGVVGDVRSRGLDVLPEAQIYVPHGRYGPENMNIAIRTHREAGSVLPAVRAVLREKNADAPMYRVETVEEAVQRQVAPTRFYLVLIGIFAGLAAVLAAVGLYGVVAYSASRRTREIGLRFALGAPREGILRMVLAQGMAPAVVGLALGLLAAYFGGQVMEAILFEVQPRDPWIFAGTSLLLLVVALLATLVPAHRASKIDPARALRFE